MRFFKNRKVKLYSKVDDTPISVWVSITSDKDLTALIKTDNVKITNKLMLKCQFHYDILYQDFITNIGLSSEMKNHLEDLRELCMLRFEWIKYQDNSILNDIKILEQRVSKNLEDEKINIEKNLRRIGKHMNTFFRKDKITISEYYSCLETIKEDNQITKKNE